jgi:hypothetical protein
MSDRPRHVCAQCGSVDDDLGRYIEQLEAERDEQKTLATTMARKYAHLQRTIAIQDGSSKKGKQATELCELWLNSPCVSDKARARVRIEPGSDRHKLAVKMLNRYPLRSDDPQALTLEKAVRGLVKFPYIVKGSLFPGMRAPHGQKHERYADLQYAIRDDKHIEQCCQLADMNPEEQLNRAVLPATQVETNALRRVQARDAEALEQARLFGELRQQVPENERDLLDRVLLTQAEFDEAEARRPYMTDEQRREHDEKWASARDARMWGRIVKTYTEANPHVLSLPLEDAA